MSTHGGFRVALVGALAVSLAACGGQSPRPAALPRPPVADSAAEATLIADLLDKGDEATARKRLSVLLKRDPMNASALMLRDSLDGDPKQLLGPASYPYTVRSGDTISGLAQRFLGNRLKAYQFGRYNELKAPITLTPGQTLRIPGQPPRPEPVRPPETSRPSPAPIVRKPKLPTAKLAPAKPAANPAAARQARTAGLAALNQGNVQRAVALLRRAAAFDPGNPMIARDLARAERIAVTVKARQ